MDANSLYTIYYVDVTEGFMGSILDRQFLPDVGLWRWEAFALRRFQLEVESSGFRHQAAPNHGFQPVSRPVSNSFGQCRRAPVLAGGWHECCFQVGETLDRGPRLCGASMLQPTRGKGSG